MAQRGNAYPKLGFLLGVWSIVCVWLFPLFPIEAQTTWTNIGSGNWTTPGNWNNGVPDSSTDATISNGGTAVISTPGQTVGNLDIGSTGSGQVQIQGGGGLVQSASAFTTLGTGSLTITGAASSFTTSSDLLVGRGTGASTIDVSAGGQLTTGRSFIGEGGGGITTATTITAALSGAGSVWDAGSLIVVGGGTATSTLTISNGALMKAQDTVGISSIGFGGLGVATVTGAGSELRLGPGTELAIGEFVNGAAGNGTLTIENAGLVTAPTLVIGAFDSATVGVLDVDGTVGSRGVLLTGGLSKDLGTASVTFDGGVLRASASSTAFIAGFSPGDIVVQSGGMFIDSNGFSIVASSGFAGTGPLFKQGVGTLTLTGTSSLAGPTTVETGTLMVNGSIGNSAVTVSAGATLAGIGTVGATTLRSGGDVAPGNGGIGVLSVNGTYAQNTGSIYQVEVDPTSSASDRIAVTGSATLASGAMINVTKTSGAPYVAGTRYTVLTTTGGLTGTYQVTGDTALTPFIGLAGVYDANNAYLEVIQTRSLTSAAQTPNQNAAAGGLQTLSSTNSLLSAAVNLSNDAAARNAFDLLSGEIYASARTAMIEDSRFARDAAINRIREAFCNAAVPVNARKRIIAAGFPQDASPSSSSDCTQNSDRFAMWGDSFGAWAQADSDGNAATLHRSIGGFFMGADAPVLDDWRIGVLGGYSRTTFDVNDRRSSGSSDDYHAGLYAGTQKGPLGLRIGSIYTWHDVKTSRSVVFPGFADSLNADYTASTTQVFGDFGYRIIVHSMVFESFADLAYINMDTAGFTETGGAAALTNYGGRVETVFSTLGARGSSTFVIHEIGITANAMLGWRHAYGDDAPTSMLSLSNGGPFDIAGVPVAKDAALVRAGLDFNMTDTAAVGVTYDAQFGSGAMDQGVRAVLTMKF